MEIKTSSNCISIINSWQVSKRDFNNVLSVALDLCPDDWVKRGVFGMKMEWAVHNFLYRLHYQQQRTCSVDLESPQAWYLQCAYAVLGCMCWVFIP